MKNDGRKRKKRLLLRIGVPILILLTLFLAGAIYVGTYYHADETAIAAFATERTVAERTLENGDLVFDPGGAKVGVIFYPGGKVEHRAYIPLMRALADRGVFCVLCRMPLRLAVLDTHAADGVRSAFPEIESWYVGGHSLGGTIAAIEVSEHPGTYRGLFLLAAFSTKDLSGAPLLTLSVCGSEDGVLNRGRYESCRKNLPADARELVIEGGCHAYFGMYGAQRGDGTPTIGNAEQIRITAAAILAWMEP